MRDLLLTKTDGNVIYVDFRGGRRMYAKRLNDQGVQYVEAGTPNAAVDCFRHALRLCPNFAEAHYNLGFVAFTQAHFWEAAGAFTYALRDKPGWLDAIYNLALSYERLRNRPLARKYFALYLDTARGQGEDATWVDAARAKLRELG
jgi:tetratricopeptide (TPR) repeat protein